MKTSQTFFCLDADSQQPVAFTIGSSARTVTQATPELLTLAEAILNSVKDQTLVLADKEHCTVELFNHVAQHTSLDLLIPQPSTKSLQGQLKDGPPDAFASPWADERDFSATQ